MKATLAAQWLAIIYRTARLCNRVVALHGAFDNLVRFSHPLSSLATSRMLVTATGRTDTSNSFRTVKTGERVSSVWGSST